MLTHAPRPGPVPHRRPGRLAPTALSLGAALGTALAIGLAAGCTPQPPAAARPVVGATAAPSDPVLAERYGRACASCHAREGSGAPLTGDTRAWAARGSGADAWARWLVSVRDGLGAMPPMGLCPDCSDAELVALSRFMAGQEQPR